MTEAIPTWSEDLDEKEKFEREKKGLISDLAKQREKNRALEERLALIEQSLSAASEEKEVQPVDQRIQRFSQDPDAYIREVVYPVIEPIQRGLTNIQLKDKLDAAFEQIADEEGITPKEARKRYDEKLASVVETHDLKGVDPYSGVLSAWKIMKTEEKEEKKREAEREERINETHSETPRSVGNASQKRWKSSEIAALIREGKYDKFRDEILKAQDRGLIIRDT